MTRVVGMVNWVPIRMEPAVATAATLAAAVLQLHRAEVLTTRVILRMMVMVSEIGG